MEMGKGDGGREAGRPARPSRFVALLGEAARAGQASGSPQRERKESSATEDDLPDP